MIAAHTRKAAEERQERVPLRYPLICALAPSAIVHDARAAHFEGFVLVIGAALCVQAALTLWVLAFSPRRERV